MWLACGPQLVQIKLLTTKPPVNPVEFSLCQGGENVLMHAQFSDENVWGKEGKPVSKFSKPCTAVRGATFSCTDSRVR